jgi:hypothetical protein
MTELRGEPLVWRPQDVAHAMGASVAAVRRMMRDGLIPTRRLGRRVIVLPDELRAWLKSAPRPQEQEQNVVGQQYDFVAGEFVSLPELPGSEGQRR